MEQGQRVFETYLAKSKTSRREKHKIHFFLPLWIPLCNKLQPFLSTMSTSALWLTSVVAILSRRRERARSNARSPLWSNSFSFPGSCIEKFLHQHTVSREDNWILGLDSSISSHTISDFSPITYSAYSPNSTEFTNFSWASSGHMPFWEPRTSGDHRAGANTMEDDTRGTCRWCCRNTSARMEGQTAWWSPARIFMKDCGLTTSFLLAV